MQSAEILDVKQFMQVLFKSTNFDAYEMVSAALRTDMDYSIDGRWNHSFFDETEIEEQALTTYTYLPWRLAKNKVFDLIKGKKTPTTMKFVFKLDITSMNKLLADTSSAYSVNDIDGIYLNILFQEHKLILTSSASFKMFTLDKSLEQEYFTSLVNMLKNNNITAN